MPENCLALNANTNRQTTKHFGTAILGSHLLSTIGVWRSAKLALKSLHQAPQTDLEKHTNDQEYS
eukprot:5010688-Amphidinium_carterae.1